MSGSQRIEEEGSLVDNDTLYIGARSDQIWLRKSGNDLVIDIMGTQNANGNSPSKSVLIQNYCGASWHIEQIVANDGKKLLWGDANELSTLLSTQVETSGATCLAETSMSTAVQASAKSCWKSDATVSNLITAMAQMAPPAAGTTLTTSDYQNRVSAIYAANVL